MLGVLLTKWTVRLALACYVACLAAWLGPKRVRRPHLVRGVWTIGCILFDVHVLCAMHFYHHWSHAAAWRHTAKRTQELLGFVVGDGVYFSYLFLVLWLIDVVWLWAPPIWDKRRDRPGSAGGSRTIPASADAIGVPLVKYGDGTTTAWRLGVHIFLLFIAINGSIVFESGPTRWAGIGCCALLGWRGARRLYNFWPATTPPCSCEMMHEP